MALYRRSGIYWVSFTGPSGRRVQRSAGTRERAAAQELHDKWKTDTWRIAKLGEKPRKQWQEAVVRWLRETSHKATHADDKLHLKWLGRYLRGKYLDQIDRDVVDFVAAEKIKEGVKNATVNRTLEVLRAVLRPVAIANTKVWRKALEQAGIKDFRWHDLRHTWASWLVQLGTPLHVLGELGSWESPEMVRRYAHLTSDHLREYAERLSRPRVVESAGDVSATEVQ